MSELKRLGLYTTQKDGKSFVRQGSPRTRRLQSTTREKWKPELREGQLPVAAEPDSSGDQTIDFPMYADHLIKLPDRLCVGATPRVSPNPPHYSEQTGLIQRELTKLLKKQAVVYVL